MNTTSKVQRVQELRRSNAATAIPGKRPAGPSASEWDEPRNFDRCTCVAWDCLGDERCGFCQETS